jgi:DnaJ like chaperone protein
MIFQLLADAASAVKRSAQSIGLTSLWRVLVPDDSAPAPANRQGLAFTMALIGLAAKLSKADGVATPIEARAFEQRFHIPESERDNVRFVFDLAKQDTAGFEAYAGQIKTLLADEPHLLHDVFECLFFVAAADGVIHAAEEQFLRTVADRFGFGEIEYQQIRNLFVVDPDSPYAVLEVDPSADDDAIKARHRALVLEHHPDRLAAHGVPETFRAAAERKLAAINAAYDQIKKHRGSSEPRI